jgi:hypothetical protein
VKWGSPPHLKRRQTRFRLTGVSGPRQPRNDSVWKIEWQARKAQENQSLWADDRSANAPPKEAFKAPRDFSFLSNYLRILLLWK